MDPGSGMYHACSRNSIISLRKPSLQCLIIQRFKDRSRPSNIVHVPILIRFLIPDSAIPRPPSSSVASGSVQESRSRWGPPSVIDTSNPYDVPIPADDIDIIDAPVPPSVKPVVVAPTFRGRPIDTRATGGHKPPTTARRFYSPPDHAPLRPVFNSAVRPRTGGTLTRTPTRMHPYSADEVTFGAETYEDCMGQFMFGEVKFKDFWKAQIPKFDSFVHWYKLFCSKCLQWVVWCPPYESAKEDAIHGAW
jgi:hypothetical protein